MLPRPDAAIRTPGATSAQWKIRPRQTHSTARACRYLLFQISVSPQLSHRSACIAGMMSVRGREWVSLIFVPHFSQLGWIHFAAGTKILGRSLSRSSANAE
jgi:hypothetical protein